MIQVAAAIIENEQGLLLIARRKIEKPQGGLWEFPGGKLEEKESPEACLRRELMEEMSIEIDVFAYFDMNEHRYGDSLIRLIAYRAKFIAGVIALIDHDEYHWVRPEQLADYSFAPADIKFVNRLLLG
ncbi:(deoxy)nucleoside triphosphate pyrophosphohydrolase [Paenibacillus sp. PL91]|uniref:(deoxy)nucleoside triphosphate pyrophosphohydrolase n=1 Tax=Paenibacillus sp. PL91 TaxID=2729538 RepID=UPI00145E5642|nr:(deoxy)nucleoside triphosphate pyrophosphohydrolase [Paenibacillus sp. PL91]MBC9203550.1 (deoxy)nucleoside triphosphate pyrophosphohydrolase [Paenibacillus sp. PL91]